MLKLKIQKEPYWLEIGYGVKVKVKPCTSNVFYQAKAYMNDKISQKIQQYKEAKDVGADISDFLDLNNPKIREAFADEHLTIGMALAGILEWDGVLEAESDERNFFQIFGLLPRIFVINIVVFVKFWKRKKTA